MATLFLLLITCSTQKTWRISWPRLAIYVLTLSHADCGLCAEDVVTSHFSCLSSAFVLQESRLQQRSAHYIAGPRYEAFERIKIGESSVSAKTLKVTYELGFSSEYSAGQQLKKRWCWFSASSACRRQLELDCVFGSVCACVVGAGCLYPILLPTPTL